MSVFLCTISKMENCNKKGFKQNEKEKDKIRILIVKDPWEGSEYEAKHRAQGLLSLSAAPRIEPFKTF